MLYRFLCIDLKNTRAMLGNIYSESWVVESVFLLIIGSVLICGGVSLVGGAVWQLPANNFKGLTKLSISLLRSVFFHKIVNASHIISVLIGNYFENFDIRRQFIYNDRVAISWWVDRHVFQDSSGLSVLVHPSKNFILGCPKYEALRRRSLPEGIVPYIRLVK